MTEIKFRVWNKTIYPDLFKSTIISLDNTGWVNINKSTNGGIDLYTGLKDKNGVEIYEGDIVKEEFNHGWCNCQVVYKNAGFFICNEREEIEDNLHWHVNGLEVIGNIYENPNLLSED